MALTHQKKVTAAPAATGLKMAFGQIDFDSSYPTGGEALDLSAEFQTIFYASFTPKSGYVFELTSLDDPSASKVKAYRGDNDNAADAPLIEVGDTVDLSAVTGVRYFIVGVAK